ncbi:MAG: ABC1 kinase family protein, partial [Acidimicrobiales bacterium]
SVTGLPSAAGVDRAAGDYRRSPMGNTSAPDLAVGSFTPSGPWLVEPGTMPWRVGIDELRARAARSVPGLLARRRLPPSVRVLRVGAELGWALAGWAMVDRGRPTSRAGLSRRLRRSFEHLGPTYIKLGQIISSGEGLFPEELVREFRLLRDRVPAEPFETVRRTIETDLGSSLSRLFVSFDPVPIASASIAQVYAATLRTGEHVVVKVQRSTVDRVVRQDIAAMSWIAPALVGRIPVAALANPPALVELFAETIVEELDFRLEAENMLDVAAVLGTAAERSIVVPRPHPSLVTRRVLVMERMEGFAWDDVVGMQEAGIDTAAVLRAGLIGFLEGAFLHGVFHGDLHGGNLLVRRDGTVALLDFGITGRLGQRRRRAFLQLMAGASSNDVRAQVAALRDLGALPSDVDVDGVIHDLHLDLPPRDPTQMSAEELTDELRTITKALLGYGARLPKELLLSVKNMLFLNGAMATMAPDVDILGEILAVVTYFAEHHGDRIAEEIGMDLQSAPIDLDGYRAALGFTEPVEAITYRELKERRELIAKRLANHRAQRHVRARTS